MSEFQQEMRVIRSRTRRTMAASVAVHACILAVLVAYRQLAPEAPVLTEVTWIDPIAPQPAFAAPPPPTPVARSSAPEEPVVRPVVSEKIERFERELPRGETAPAGQSPGGVEDRLAQRLASLQHDAGAARVLATAPGPGGISGGMSPADIDPKADVLLPPVTLRRDTRASGPPQALRRAGPGSGTGSGSAVTAALPVAAPRPAAAPGGGGGGSGLSVRNLAGVSLTGPVADRRLLSYAAPLYPDGAKREGIEGSVSLRFVVLEDGTVKQSVLIEKTSGYEDFDRNAEDALRTWRFEPLDGGTHGDQWGVITFHYRLSGGAAAR